MEFLSGSLSENNLYYAMGVQSNSLAIPPLSLTAFHNLYVAYQQKRAEGVLSHGAMLNALDADKVRIHPSGNLSRSQIGLFVTVMKLDEEGQDPRAPAETPSVKEVLNDLHRSAGNVLGTLPWGKILLVGAGILVLTTGTRAFIGKHF